MHFYHQYLSTYYLFLDERNCCWIRPFYSICSCSRPNSRRICCLCQSWQYHQFNVYNQFVLSSSTWYYLVSWLKGMYKVVLQNLKKWCYTIIMFLLELELTSFKKSFFSKKKPFRVILGIVQPTCKLIFDYPIFLILEHCGIVKNHFSMLSDLSYTGWILCHVHYSKFTTLHNILCVILAFEVICTIFNSLLHGVLALTIYIA